jgi:hypothetical protein
MITHAEESATDAGYGIYLYGVVSSASDVDIELDPMNPDGRIQMLSAAGLTAVCEKMPLAPWSGPDSVQNLQTLEWVAPRAVHHETVTEAIACRTPLFPMTFGTLFSSREAMTEHLDERAEELHNYLDRVEGRSEWSVKGLLDRATARRHLSESDEMEAETGLGYLQKRKKQAETRIVLEPWLRDVGSDIYARLADRTADQTVLQKRGRTRVEDGRAIVFNWALLIEDAALEHIEAFIDDWNATNDETGLELALSGPWPPYSFRTTAGKNDV